MAGFVNWFRAHLANHSTIAHTHQSSPHDVHGRYNEVAHYHILDVQLEDSSQVRQLTVLKSKYRLRYRPLLQRQHTDYRLTDRRHTHVALYLLTVT